ncbi:hypothetical protein GCK72_008262 [Caenorhabditis remanei]|uniref:Prospero domain-containing protein n=1 Tax=Caenorhabditis remanei TaxID=31234 RepID=A0A6A5GZS3_CAERE|nr:hypothetical protein GCK72_008262 [Caenorhabditis remanei]KAF1760016.1 hypothetical protein GCK72_008262 [Caenorhabditis remanei]
MSSGVPPVLAAAQPAANGFNFSPVGFPSFGYLFPPIVNSNGGGSSSSNRFKVKRHRQRVDAGEPRNTYQGTNTTVISSNTSTSSATSSTSSTSSKKLSESEASTTTTTMTTSFERENSLKLNEEAEEIEAMKMENENTAQEEQDEIDADYEEINGGVGEEEDVEEEERESPESNSSTSSASKRKSFQPQKIGEELGIDIGEETEQINVTVGGGNTTEDSDDVPEEPETKEFSALQAQLQNGNNTFHEQQRRLYTAFIEQQKKQLVAASMLSTNKVNYDQLINLLKGEVMDNLWKNVEKIIKEWAANEMSKQEPATPAPQAPPSFHPIFPPNPLFHMPPPHHPMNGMNGGGIFPPNFNAFNAFSALRRNFQDADEPKRKRTKLDIKKEDIVSSRASPLSASASPPLGRFFPAPTMVGHHYGGMNFGDREDSPTNSDELSDCGYEGNGSSSMLTPMHLRKAKLMFFYTRYPNSNLLKSYFPDIRFNKNNTAQLVKWFSNFREFYYIQMEKFARQAMSEGITDRSEIFVSKDSELFKVLNTHYNRNNHIKAPDRLVLVVQETLREFYDAIKLGKDAEPSWKKTIYKVINRLDDQIPEFFKEPNFLERLES